MKHLIINITLGLWVLLSSTCVWAQGVAGELILNTATINYQVDGAAAPEQQASVVFNVDRQLDVVVQSQLNAPLNSATGATNQALPFVVTNLSNAPIGILLNAQLANSWTSSGQTYNTIQTYATNDFSVFVDSNSNNRFEPDLDTQQFIATLEPGATQQVFVVTDMPSNTVTDDVYLAVSLVAQVAETGTVGEAGSAYPITNDDRGNISPAGSYADGSRHSVGQAQIQRKQANPHMILDVFTDSAGDLNSAGGPDQSSNGQHSDTAGYKISSAPLTINKSVVSINAQGEPREASSGAILRYTLDVLSRDTNSDIVITDVIPNGTQYQGNSITLDGKPLSDSEDGDQARLIAVGTNGAPQIQVSIPQLQQGQSKKINFDVVIE